MITSHLILGLLLVSSTVSVQAVEDTISNPLDLYQFDFLSGIDLGLGNVLAVTGTSNYFVFGGQINNEVVIGGINSPIVTICEEKNTYPDLIKGKFGDKTYNCDYDGLIFATNPDGEVLWGSYIGGAKADSITDLAIDHQNNIIVIGTTESNFLTGTNMFDNQTESYGDGYVMKLNSSGAMIWASYLGGNYVDQANDVIVDSQNNIIVAGFTKSNDFPLHNAIDSEFEGDQFGGGEMFITKFLSNGTNLWSTYIGGAEFDSDYSIAIDQQDNLFVSGLTKSSKFPFITNLNETNQGKIDVFLLKISSEGQLDNAKLLGGFLSDVITQSAIDSEGNLVMIGYTSSPDFPIVNGFDNTLNSDPNTKVYTDAIVVKMNTDGEILWSTYLGGDGADEATSLHLNSRDEIIILGTTSSLDFPFYIPYNVESGLNGLKTYKHGDQPSDIFTTIISKEGNLEYSFYFGGSGNEFLYSSGFTTSNVIVVGQTASGNTFPTINSTVDIELNNFIGSFSFPSNYTLLPPYGSSSDNHSHDLFQFSGGWTLSIVIIVVMCSLSQKIYRKWRLVKMKKNDQKQNEFKIYLDKLRNP